MELKERTIDLAHQKIKTIMIYFKKKKFFFLPPEALDPPIGYTDELLLGLNFFTGGSLARFSEIYIYLHTYTFSI